MNKIDFDVTLPDKVINLEKQVELVERKIQIISEILQSPVSSKDLTPEGSLAIVELEEKKLAAQAELLAKKDWLKKLKAKLRVDEKEFEKNLAESNNYYSKLSEVAEKWISDTEHKQAGKSSYLTIMVAFIVDNLAIAFESKEVGAKVHYYNLLKKQLTELGVTWS